jgi:hypothetical protein
MNAMNGEILLPGEDGPKLPPQERLSAFVSALEQESKRRVMRRTAVEQRWIENLRQLHGKYDDLTLTRIEQAKGSSVFVNLTATKTEAMIARIYDLLFPTDERNWAIDPTPVPTLTREAEEAMAMVQKAHDAAEAQKAAMQEAEAQGQMPTAQAREQDMRQAEAIENDARAAADNLQKALDEARKRSRLMEEEIADQLSGCNFPAEARDMIVDACEIGFGVIKGPVLNERPAKKWQQGQEGYSLEVVGDTAPGAFRVDPWNYFPDPDSRRVEDGNGHYERHFLNASQLRKLAKRPDMDKNAIRDVLLEGPVKGEVPSYLSDLHQINGETEGLLADKFVVWEFTGPVEREDLATLAEAMWSPEERAGFDPSQIDPLLELGVRVWFSQGKVLSFALHPLDSCDSLYSVFTIREDPISPFGYGIPHIMASPQSILNGAYRMMMDNSGLGAGPQVLVNKEVVSPEDGDWTLRPRKVWLMNSTALTQQIAPFQAINIDTHQAELQAIITLAAQTIDEVTAMPQITQGEPGSTTQQTAQGLAMLLTSANVSFRRIIKNFDDNVTVRLLSRFYHWNMQFSSRAEIKGDYDVVARGSSVLLVREMQAQNLVMVANAFGDHAVYGPMIKHSDLLRAIFRAHMIPADEIVYSDAEFERRQRDQQPQKDPAVQVAEMEAQMQQEELKIRREEMQAKIEVANMETHAKVQVATLTYQAAMQGKALDANLRSQDGQAKVAVENMKVASAERKTAVEVAMKEATGESSGGSI